MQQVHGMASRIIQPRDCKESPSSHKACSHKGPSSQAEGCANSGLPTASPEPDQARCSRDVQKWQHRQEETQLQKGETHSTK